MIKQTEQIISSFLQKDVVFFINCDKPIKSGKLLIFKLKDFYFNFVIKKDNTLKTFELPYPFAVTDCGDHIKFSYTVDDFSQKNLDLLYKAKILTPRKRNKLYNSTVVLSAIS
jgi:hypothetical protein